MATIVPQETAGASSQTLDDTIVAHQAETTIEVEDLSDTGYKTDLYSSASTSITSSIRDYAFESGRRYHKFHEGSYQFPNDESEQEREDMKHAIVVNLCGGHLHYDPLDSPQTIIDLCTGTGLWAIDSKRLFPFIAVRLDADRSM